MITKNMILAIAAIAIIIGGIIIYLQQAPPAPKTSSGGGEENYNVSIENFSFNPSALTIKAGGTVIWTNNDSAQHSIKLDTFNSQPFSKGQTFEFKFDNKGSYDYSCGIHPSMKGKIIVD